MGQIQLTIALVMIGLFSFAIIAFSMNFADDNSAAINIDDDAKISSIYTQQSTNLTDFATSSEEQYKSIANTTIAPGSDSPQSSAPFSITPSNALHFTKNVFELGYLKIFGTNSGFAIFSTTLIAIIIFMMGLFVYKTLRGMPD